MNKVIFEKPDIKSLKKDGYACYDMHCHSAYSDGVSSVESIARKCRKLGISVALTDHNEIKGAVRIARIKNLNAIPGIEITSSEGTHTLAYFYDASELSEFNSKVVKKNMHKGQFSELSLSFPEIVEKAGSYNCRICTAHPFGSFNTGVHTFASRKEYAKAIRKIDFVEAINASHKRIENIKAAKWAEKIGKFPTAGSDAHASFFIGKAVTAVHEGKHFLDSVGKKSIAVGHEVNPAFTSMRNLLKLRIFALHPKTYVQKAVSLAFKRR